ncbi:hypothetical protein [Methylobacterium dankookense]|uniref:DUF4365 domain-containing protein n=1 Tax=Methylobacterium dankookense TaxID=560405 RepID=A0A564G3J9_9HYPH|nr:hypothetical protein [Methylobacterium dankookense]GJD58260.1 hypothetical protein IFDJLNFL_4177 [Methylobacterium dankookense]VUF14171.1 hypothetical protein MTDSW087_03887 [Methylobacterium dankookense]
MGTVRKLSSEELGNRGEKEFDSLCSSTKLIVNSVKRDLTGWDFLIEFPQEAQSNIPLDVRNNPHSCKIQIKAMWEDNDEVKFRLSSLERLAKDPGPTFVCVLKFGPDLKCTKLYFIHLLDDNLALVLKRLRSESAKGISKINNKEVAIRPSKIGIEIKPDGGEIERTILKQIGDSFEAYTSKKSSQLRNLGFEQDRLTFSVTFKVPPKQIAEAFLGSGEALEVSRFEGVESRFGIPLPILGINGPGRLSIQPTNPGTYTIALRSLKGGLPVILVATMYSIPPAMAARLGGPQVRLDTGLLDIRMKAKSCTITALEAGKLNIKASLSDWLSHFKALKIMVDGNFVFELRSQGKKLLNERFKESMQHVSKDNLQQATLVAQRLQKLVALTHSRVDEKFTLHAMMGSCDQIELAHTLCFGSESAEPITIDFDFSRSDLVEDGTGGRLISFIPLGGKLLVFAVPVKSIDFNSNPRVVVDVPSGEQLEIDLVDRSDYSEYIECFRDIPEAPLLLFRDLKQA